jgi:hypothetical protein
VRISTLALLGCLLPAALSAQQASTPAQPAAQAGLTVVPKWGQSKEQQLQSEQECYGRARVQTGVDPTMIRSPADSASGAQADSASGGATTGIIGGRRVSRQERLQADALQQFRKSMSACLAAGGYTVE